MLQRFIVHKLINTDPFAYCNKSDIHHEEWQNHLFSYVFQEILIITYLYLYLVNPI